MIARFTESVELQVKELAKELSTPEGRVISYSIALLKWVVNESNSGTRFIVERPRTIARIPFLGELNGVSAVKSYSLYWMA